MLEYSRIADLSKQKSPSALCIVTATSGSTPRKSGARMVVIDDGSEHGSIEGSIGGGAVENQLRLEALAVIKSGQAKMLNFALTQELAMCCGGSMSVYIEALVAKSQCLIFGAGHISEALCYFASRCDLML